MLNLVLLLGFFISLVLSSTPGHADESDTNLQCTMITVVRPVLPVNQSLISKDILNRILPTNMTPTTNADLFAAQFQSGMEQRISQEILAGQLFRTSTIGKTTTKVESLLSSPKDTQSKITFQIKVPERQAIVNYKGAINSEIVWVVEQGSFKWTLSKAFTPSTSVALTTVASTNPTQYFSSSMISLTHTF